MLIVDIEQNKIDFFVCWFLVGASGIETEKNG